MNLYWTIQQEMTLEKSYELMLNLRAATQEIEKLVENMSRVERRRYNDHQEMMKRCGYDDAEEFGLRLDAAQAAITRDAVEKRAQELGI